MLKKPITYTDYNGATRTETFYFGLNKAEIMDLELGVEGGMRQMLKMVIEKQNIPQIIDIFKKLIRMSYGEKSPDGRRFIKSPELTEAFVQTEAYVELYMEMLGDADKAADFINGIMPSEILAAMQEKEKNEKANAEAQDANLMNTPTETKTERASDANLLNNIVAIDHK